MNDQTNFRRYALYSHESRGLNHDVDKDNNDKTNENGEENEQLMSFLENAAKYFRNCIILLKSKYQSENFSFVESKFEVKVEKNEASSNKEENKEVEINKFSDKFEKLLIFSYIL